MAPLPGWLACVPFFILEATPHPRRAIYLIIIIDGAPLLLVKFIRPLAQPTHLIAILSHNRTRTCMLSYIRAAVPDGARTFPGKRERGGGEAGVVPGVPGGGYLQDRPGADHVPQLPEDHSSGDCNL